MFKNLIGGEWVEGPRVSRNINPSDTRDVVGEFAQADAAQARQAIAAATRQPIVSSGSFCNSARQLQPGFRRQPAGTSLKVLST